MNLSKSLAINEKEEILVGCVSETSSSFVRMLSKVIAIEIVLLLTRIE